MNDTEIQIYHVKEEAMHGLAIFLKEMGFEIEKTSESKPEWVLHELNRSFNCSVKMFKSTNKDVGTVTIELSDLEDDE